MKAEKKPLMKLTGGEFPRLEDTEYGKRKAVEASTAAYPVRTS